MSLVIDTLAPLDALARLAARAVGAPSAALFRVGEHGPECAAAWGDGAVARLAPSAAAALRRTAAEPGRAVFVRDAAAGTTCAAVALRTSDGAPLALLVGDDPARAWDDDALEALGDVARALGAMTSAAPAAIPSRPTPPTPMRPSGTWTWDLTTDSITWSEEVNRILGLPRGPIVVGTNPLLALVHPDDHDALVSTIRAAMHEGHGFAFTYRIVRPNRGVRWVRVRGRVVDADSDGEATLLVGTCEDVTEAQHTAGPDTTRPDAAGRRSDLLAVVIETMREVARTELDVDVMTHRIAERAMELTRADGGAFGTLDGDTILYRALVGAQYKETAPFQVGLGESLSGFALEAGDVVRCDDTDRDPRVHHDTTRRLDIRSMLLVPLVYRREPIGVLTVVARRPNAFTDDDGHVLQLMAGVAAALVSHAGAFAAKSALVAERTAALAALREAHETLAVVVRAAPVAIVTMTRDFVITGWNQAAERICGWSAAEAVGQALPTLGKGDGAAEAARAALADGAQHAAVFETRTRRKDGTQVDVAITAAPLRDAEGRPRGLVAVLADMTERKRLEARLRQAQRMEAVGQLAGGIAHDFNNLLTIIQLHAETLLEELPSEASLREDAVEIERQTERAAGLTRQLLAFSRKQLLQPRLLDMNAAVRDVQKMLARVIGEDIAIVTTLDDGVGHVLADPDQLTQVLLNLAVNARDAMPGGGSLTIRTANVWLDASYGDLHGAVVPEGPYVMLAVSDDGTGMDRATQARIFEPFFTTKEPGRGTGLGLATVYGIVKQSGGYVWVYSELGIGSTFKVYLPRVSDGAAADEPEPSEERGGTETILLVEDEEELRALARQHLAQLGYTVLVAHGGEEALRLAAEHAGPLHLLVTDLVMPGLSGTAIAERLRALRPDARVLLMSGYTDDDIMRRGLLAPRQAMLMKPFSRRALAAAVRRALES